MGINRVLLYLGSSYICEISPPRNRGALTTGPQLLITLGLVTGFFTCYGTANIQSSFSWRLPFILLAAYSIAFSIAVLMWLPASPRWLTLHGKTKEASMAWEKLDVPTADREKILDQYDASVVETAIPGVSGDTGAVQVTSTTAAASKSKKTELLDVFSSDARPRLFLAVFLMGMQQLSGIDGVLYVSYPPCCSMYLCQKCKSQPCSSTHPSFSNKPVYPQTNLRSSPLASRPSLSLPSPSQQPSWQTSGAGAPTPSSVAWVWP